MMFKAYYETANYRLADDGDVYLGESYPSLSALVMAFMSDQYIVQVKSALPDVHNYDKASRILRKFKGKYLYAKQRGLMRIIDSRGLDFQVRNLITGKIDWIDANLSSRYVLNHKTQAKRLLKRYQYFIRKYAMAFYAQEQKQMREIERNHYSANGYKHKDKLLLDKARGKELAFLLSQALDENNEDFELDDFIDKLNSRNLSTNLRTRLFNKVANVRNDITDEYFICPDCGYAERLDGSCTDINDNVICDTCANENYYYSEYHGAYIHTDDARPLYETYRQYSNESAADWLSYSGEYSEYRYEDGAYFTDDAWYDVYGSDDEDNDGLAGYHDSYRNFVEVASDKRFVPLGVELEVYAHDRADVVQSLKSNFNDLYLERDGSLDDYHGFEIITQPYGKTEWAEFAPRLLNHLLERRVLGYNHPDDASYGIHISVNREYLSPLQEARMSLFLTAAENEYFVKAIAQRNAIYGGSTSVQFGAFDKRMQKVHNIGGLGRYFNNKKKIYGMGKYSPLNLKDTVAECRIFQSTLHPQSFMKNLEFMWALVEWTNTTSATGSTWLHTDFVQWLCLRPDSDTDFGHLMAYLRKDKYIVKRGSGSIENTWAKYLPLITTKSQPVEGNVEESLDDTDEPESAVISAPVEPPLYSQIIAAA